MKFKPRQTNTCTTNLIIKKLLNIIKTVNLLSGIISKFSYNPIYLN